MLFVLGLAVLVWLPPSFFFYFYLGGGGIGLSSGDESFQLLIAPGSGIVDEYSAQVGRNTFDLNSPYFWPRVTFNSPTIFADIPLWLLAVLCLAWPVISFIVHRRKRQRGFTVEAVGTREIVNEE